MNMEAKNRRGLPRYYNANPESMTLEMCAVHGANHKGYNWNPQPDPRWDDEQYEAYINAYDGTENRANFAR